MDWSSPTCFFPRIQQDKENEVHCRRAYNEIANAQGKDGDATVASRWVWLKDLWMQ